MDTGVRKPRPLLLGMGWFPDQAGGLNRYLASLFGELRRQGAEPTAVVLGPMAERPDGVHLAGTLDDGLFTRLRGFSRAARVAAAASDVVDIHFALYGLLPMLLRSWGSRPIVVHFQGPWAEESRAAGEARGPRLWAKWAVETAVYRRAGELVVLSSAFKRVLVERYGVSPWRVSVIPPGVDLETFRPGSRHAARAALGIDEAAWVAVAVRRLVPRMGVDVLLRAWPTVLARRREARLVVAGEGAERVRLEALARDLGVTTSVDFLGRISDETLRDLYRTADVVVVPSVELEGYGLVVLESLASGTPVVGSDAGGLPEALVDLDRSLVVAAGDAESLGRRLAAAADGSQPLPTPENCRASAEGFSWSAVARRNQEMYARALEVAAPRRPRVVYLDHCARLSAGELALLHLLPAMEGIDTHVILGEDGPLVGLLQASHVSTEVLGLPAAARDLPRARARLAKPPVLASLQTVFYIVRLARRLRQLRPDLVHTNSLKSLVYGSIASRLAGIPVVCHLRDRLSDDYLPASARRVVSMVLRRLPCAVIVNSVSTRETLLQTVRMTRVIPSPVAYDPVHSVAAPVAPGGRQFVVSMVGRLSPWKGQDLFLEAFARAFPDGPEQGWVIGTALFGEDDYAAGLKRRTVELGLAQRITFTGHRNDVVALLRASDVAVHASTVPEPFGQVVLEGMASGVAVVAADGGGPTEVIRDGVNGMLFRSGDRDDLARVMTTLRDDPELRRRLGSAGQATARAFSPKVVAAQVADVYRPILGGRQPLPAGD